MIQFAKSKSGHDKDQIFYIVREEEDFVYLADGVHRSCTSPKKKNRKHIQIIKDLPAEVTRVFQQEPIEDVKIKRALKLYTHM